MLEKHIAFLRETRRATALVDQNDILVVFFSTKIRSLCSHNMSRAGLSQTVDDTFKAK